MYFPRDTYSKSTFQRYKNRFRHHRGSGFIQKLKIAKIQECTFTFSKMYLNATSKNIQNFLKYFLCNFKKQKKEREKKKIRRNIIAKVTRTMEALFTRKVNEECHRVIVVPLPTSCRVVRAGSFVKFAYGSPDVRETGSWPRRGRERRSPARMGLSSFSRLWKLIKLAGRINDQLSRRPWRRITSFRFRVPGTPYTLSAGLTERRGGRSRRQKGKGYSRR